MSSASETWTLRRRGIALSRIELLGDDAVVLARIRPIDALRTEVNVHDGGDLSIDQWIGGMQIGDGNQTIARVVDGVLTVGSEPFEYVVQDDGSRSVMVRSNAEATPLLETRPGRSGPSQWATLAIHPGLPEPLAVAALASAALLRAETAGDTDGSWGWSSAGPASIG